MMWSVICGRLTQSNVYQYAIYNMYTCMYVPIPVVPERQFIGKGLSPLRVHGTCTMVPGFIS